MSRGAMMGLAGVGGVTLGAIGAVTVRYPRYGAVLIIICGLAVIAVLTTILVDHHAVKEPEAIALPEPEMSGLTSAQECPIFGWPYPPPQCYRLPTAPVVSPTAAGQSPFSSGSVE